MGRGIKSDAEWGGGGDILHKWFRKVFLQTGHLHSLHDEKSLGKVCVSVRGTEQATEQGE